MFKSEVSHVTERSDYPETLAIKKTAHIRYNQQRQQFTERATKFTQHLSVVPDDRLANLSLPIFYTRYSEETLRAVLGEKFDTLRRLSLSVPTQGTGSNEQNGSSDVGQQNPL